MKESAIAANRAPLDWLSFFLADVQGGLGPFLAIYLLQSLHWNPGRIGLLLTIGGLSMVLARGPAGALVDALRCKRALTAAAVTVLMATACLIALWPRFWPVAVAQALNGAADAIFPAALAGMSLGIVGREMFTRRIGRNEAFNHAGNVSNAIAAGLAGYLIAPVAVLWMTVAIGVATILACFAIDPRAIDHDLARGADDGDGPHPPAGLPFLFGNRALLLFTAAATLFHFANAAMLPLLGEHLASGHQQAGSLFMASCIITAQLAMVPMAILVGRFADVWGRKPLFLIGFAVLPIRGVLYTLAHDPYALVSIQILDGVGAGIFGALFPVVIADLTKGSGRYNLAMGASGACWGLGAALSNGVAGLIVDAADYDAAFLFLAACAGLALLVFCFGVPETRRRTGGARRGALQAAPE